MAGFLRVALAGYLHVLHELVVALHVVAAQRKVRVAVFPFLGDVFEVAEEHGVGDFEAVVVVERHDDAQQRLRRVLRLVEGLLEHLLCLLYTVAPQQDVPPDDHHVVVVALQVVGQVDVVDGRVGLLQFTVRESQLLIDFHQVGRAVRRLLRGRLQRFDGLLVAP